MLYITHMLYIAKTFSVTKVKDGFFHRKKIFLPGLHSTAQNSKRYNTRHHQETE